MVFRDMSCCDSESGYLLFVFVNTVANESRTLAFREREPSFSQDLDHGVCETHGFVHSVEFACTALSRRLVSRGFCLRL